MRAEWGDARAGNYGIYENRENYGKKVGASLNGCLGLHGRWGGDGAAEYKPG